ncbi:hypothetical protein SAMN05216456_1606 [Devosia crocina]|uniref:Uncharacterized protein n=1 Tax=Devosia crocina TaxID=429728 RepID=A0A1I7NCA6_9HYPH|nr:hypothetical protein SAMN05216456_1606 [Devosia crocina]
MRFLRAFVVLGIPLLVAAAAGLFLLLWIMGASAVQGEGPSLGYSVGLVALFSYPAACQVFIIAWAICQWQRWRIAQVFVRLMWVSLIFFAAAMAYALYLLSPYLAT